MESVENQKRERYSRDDSPGQESKELSLHSHGDVSVSHEGVEDPERDVGKQHEGYDLSPGFRLLLSAGRTNSPAGLTDDHA